MEIDIFLNFKCPLKKFYKTEKPKNSWNAFSRSNGKQKLGFGNLDHNSSSSNELVDESGNYIFHHTYSNFWVNFDQCQNQTAGKP